MDIDSSFCLTAVFESHRVELPHRAVELLGCKSRRRHTVKKISPWDFTLLSIATWDEKYGTEHFDGSVRKLWNAQWPLVDARLGTATGA